MLRGALVKVVVDTNIWISSLIASSKTAVGLIDAWEKETFRLLVSEQQIVELAEVILRPKFCLMYRFSPQEIKDIIDSISAKQNGLR
ncbi:MAG: putative toxin-antitoxin system toxin component, PIN family [Nitrospirae bacterium]|nr:putative toxin-antitoxin system toxin component, PIN family [Nitrospirota bacterium]